MLAAAGSPGHPGICLWESCRMEPLVRSLQIVVWNGSERVGKLVRTGGVAGPRCAIFLQCRQLSTRPAASQPVGYGDSTRKRASQASLRRSFSGRRLSQSFG